MRSHYPILSVVAAIVALSVPAILIALPHNPQEQDTTADPASAEITKLRTEVQRLGQTLAEIRERMVKLESVPPPKQSVTVREQLASTAHASRPSPLMEQQQTANSPPAQSSKGIPESQPVARSTVHRDEAPTSSGLVGVAGAASDESIPAKRSRTDPSIMVPYPSDTSEGTHPSPAVATPVTSLPEDRSQLLMPAQPPPRVASRPTLPPPRQVEVVEVPPREEVDQELSASGVGVTTVQTAMAKKKRTSRKLPAGVAKAASNELPLDALPPEFAELEADQLDDWKDHPPFNLTITRPSSGVVHHWEEFVATTNVPGWPVVMVRSETEGDHWWVQQLVARRGNIIAAKVSFGNEDTVAGHQFEVVVLLLESSAETVRFKTARKFEDLPKGVQRSAVYRYVRG